MQVSWIDPNEIARLAAQLQRARIGHRHAKQHAQRGGLAGPVGAQQAKALAAPYGKTQVVDDHLIAIALAQAFDAQDRCAAHAKALLLVSHIASVAKR